MEVPPVVRFRDLSVPASERGQLLRVLELLMERGEFILGSDVAAFERAFAERNRRQHCVGVSSGTAALYLALRALGIGPGDEVIMPAMSWVATANAVAALGAVPVFVDVGADFNLDPSAADDAISPRTKALLPVHFYGRMAQMPRIMEIARNRGLLVIEDAAQAFGASMSGRPAGSFGDAAAFSLNPMKSLAALGEAGAVVTDNEGIAARVRSLRNLGMIDAEVCVEPSLNFKIDTLQAAILLERLPREPSDLAHRGRIASTYRGLLHDIVTVPEEPADGSTSWFEYTIVCSDRDRLALSLDRQGIEVKVRHRTLLADQPAYTNAVVRPIHHARQLVRGILCLPIHSAMDTDDATTVAEGIRRFYDA